jgi:competence CoiA-like predicted nuclease
MLHGSIPIAIDSEQNTIVSIEDVRLSKDSYKRGKHFLCPICNDKLTFVNCKLKQEYFRHYPDSACTVAKEFPEFQVTFYHNWYNLWKPEYKQY